MHAHLEGGRAGPGDEAAREGRTMADEGTSRRGFLKTATVAIGGAIGALAALPLIRFIVHPIGKGVVTSAAEPVDVMAVDALAVGAEPVRVELRAATLRDAWSTQRDVPLGAAWLQKSEDGEVHAFSSVCPHLGCAVGFNAEEKQFVCPCHRSAFGRDGARLYGPSKRGLDPLPVAVEDGRVKVQFVRYELDTSDRKPV
jgi:menaquinol-cytochrome c reductase iron-sulfur subunit